MSFVGISYDANYEAPVPSEWRKTIETIVQVLNLPEPSKAIAEIKNVFAGDNVIAISLGQIEDDPASRVWIGPKTWESSICVWQEGYWELIIDLHIDDELEEVSDLILPIKIKCAGSETHFEANFIHAP